MCMRVVKSSKPFKKLSSYFKSKKQGADKSKGESTKVEDVLNQILSDSDTSLETPDRDGNQVVFHLGEPIGIINMRKGLANIGGKMYKFNSYQVKANPIDDLPEVVKASADGDDRRTIKSKDALRQDIEDVLDENLCVEVVNIGFSTDGEFDDVVFLEGDDNIDEDASFFGSLIDDLPKDIALKFFNGKDLDSHGSANPNRDYFRYDKKGNIESTNDPGAIYYDTIFDDIVDYIMDNLETVEFPDDIQELINDYLENEDKE